MERSIIRTDGAPKNEGINAGHFNQAMRVGDVVYIGGTLAIDPKEMVVIKEPAAAVKMAYTNMSNICKEAGGSMQDIVMLYVLVSDLSILKTVNEVQATFIKDPHPPRSVMQVAALPHGNLIELVATMVPRN